jgi:hypothetical protein
MRNAKKCKTDYDHKFSLRIGEIIHINGIPCEYLGRGTFGTNTYPGKPQSLQEK